MSKTISSIEAASLNLCTLKIKKLDDQAHEIEAEYKLALDFNGFAKAFDQTSLDFTSPKNWTNLNPSTLSILLWCAFDRFHPEVTLKEVRSWLGPAQAADLWVMLFEMTFPGVLDRIKTLSEQQSPGESQPNTQGA